MNPNQLVPAVRKALTELEPGLPVFDMVSLDDRLNRGRLGREGDVREDELVPQPLLDKCRPRRLEVVLRANRRNHTPPIERPDQLGTMRMQFHRIAVGERALPQGVVEIPDDELDRCGPHDVIVGRPRTLAAFGTTG